VIKLKIREAQSEDAAGIARVHVDSWRTTYRGIISEEVLANLSYENRERGWARGLSDPNRKTFDFVAENDSGEIVGFATGGQERTGDQSYKGELYAIYILEQFQGQGVGNILTQAIVQRLAQSGMTSMLVWVLVDNPSLHFYEALGGQRIKQQPIEIGGETYEEIAYGWEDITVLIK
jgi:ribosomal protein S18 acetylase RimI-like enzyme